MLNIFLNSMQLHFNKYQGTGNDFVLIDNRKGDINLTKEQVQFLCHRRFVIGADGLMLLNPHNTLDFTMVYYNSDGNTSTMCGNGGRCIVAFAKKIGAITDKTTFEGIDGSHDAIVNQDNTVSLKMIDVDTVEVNANYYYLNTGSPHYVEFVEDIEHYEVFAKGKAIRNNERFKAVGTNVNFVEPMADGIYVRTYERGVEDETYSCGTGVTASAISAGLHLNPLANSFNINTLGGKLNVRFERKGNGFNNIWLSGPATHVFSGSINL